MHEAQSQPRLSPSSDATARARRGGTQRRGDTTSLNPGGGTTTLHPSDTTTLRPGDTTTIKPGGGTAPPDPGQTVDDAAAAAKKRAAALRRPAARTNIAITTGASANQLVLDVAGGSTQPGAPVIQWWHNGGSNHRWNVVPPANGTARIVNQNSGLCLTTDGVSGTPLYQQRCLADGYGAGPLQEWTGNLPPFPFAGTSLMNPVSGLVVDVAGGNPLPGASVIAFTELRPTFPPANQTFSYLQF